MLLFVYHIIKVFYFLWAVGAFGVGLFVFDAVFQNDEIEDEETYADYHGEMGLIGPGLLIGE